MKKENSSRSDTRRPRRFFSDEAIEKVGQLLTLSQSESKHLHETLRLEVGDICRVVDGRDHEAEAVVKSLLPGTQVQLRIESILPSFQEKGLCLILYPALLQKGKTDDLVEKAQELGVQSLMPIETERTVARMNPKAQAKVLQRWSRISQEAAKQSGTRRLIDIREPQSLKDALSNLSEKDKIVFFHPTQEAMAFETWVKSVSLSQKMHLFLGPEGGFSEKEVLRLEEHGATKVRLTETILRADTAFIGVVASLRFLFNEKS